MEYKLHSLLLSYTFRIILLIDYLYYLFKVNLRFLVCKTG